MLKRKTPLKGTSTLRRTPFKRKHTEKNSGKPKSKSVASIVTRLDRVFSQYIRLRDSHDDETFACISCGRRLSLSYAQCGHYYPRANMSTRFDPDNCHAECIHCNCFDQNHLEGYRKNLIAKIGEGRVAELDRRAKETKKWSHYELEEMIEFYKERIKQ